MNLPATGTPPLRAIALLSATALAYEVLLTRLFAIIQWHHFASMIISLALLGYGASGSLLTRLGTVMRRRFADCFVGSIFLFTLSALTAFLLAQRVPFNALEIGWDPRQLGMLLLLYLLLAVPFFWVASALGLTYLHYGAQIHRLYAFDLMGAGAGALGVILLLYIVPPVAALLILYALGLVAAGVALLETRGPRWGWLVGLGLVVLGFSLPAPWTALQMSAYKGLSQSLQVVGAQVIAERSSPLGLLSVVRNTVVPFRYAPGLSLTTTTQPPPQLGLFSDGEELGAITPFTGRLDDLAYLDNLTSALPYHLLPQPHVLVLGAGGGADVLQALYHRARRVEAVELNPQVVELVRDDFGAFTDGLYDRADVQVHIAEARGFVASHRQSYDLIQMTLLDTFNTTAAGLHALNTSALYTVEAFQHYLQHLNPSGLLAITSWLRQPPRDSLKLFATAVVALERLGVPDPGAQLVLIQGWKTTTLMVKNGAFSPEDKASIRQFCQRRAFDPAWYAGMQADEANHFNDLEPPDLYTSAIALLGPERETFLERYPFNLRPATDDRPYFFHFFKWRELPALWAKRAHGGLGQLEWGYLVLIATLVQALLASVVLILLPLCLGRRSERVPARGLRGRVLIYFIAIGLGFLFLEIAFIQQCMVFLSHPLYAVAVGLCTFLVGAGLGSAVSRRFADPRRAVRWAVAGITGWALVSLLALPAFFQWALPWPEPIKWLCAIGSIVPLAFGMGMPFPLGLSLLARTAPGLVPWAWAINGCASVVSAVLATVLAMQIGFSGVVLAAVMLYLVAAAVTPPLRIGGVTVGGPSGSLQPPKAADSSLPAKAQKSWQYVALGGCTGRSCRRVSSPTRG